MSQKQKIIIASSQPLLAAGIKAILESNPEWSIVAMAEDAEHLKALCMIHFPDLIVTDRNLSGLYTEENLEENNAFLSNYRVTLISDFDKESIYKLHKLSITGFLTTFSQPQEILEAVRNNINGIKYFSPRVVEVLIEMSFRNRQPEKQAETQLHESLSEREMEVFMRVTQGKSTKEIADELFLSTHTVYTHRKNILKKLSCKSAAELINYAYAQGLMEKE